MSSIAFRGCPQVLPSSSRVRPNICSVLLLLAVPYHFPSRRDHYPQPLSFGHNLLPPSG
jgi:hypothetical protein